jgi:magnesium-transporting ATPase (P-type)
MISIQIFNVVFTGLPIILFATFDTEFDKTVLYNTPQLYKDGQDGIHFNTRVFWDWMLYTLVQSTAILYITFGIMNDGLFTIVIPSQTPSMWVQGCTVLILVTIIVNFKLILDTYSINALMIIINLLSTATIIICYYVVQFFAWDELYASFNELYGMPVVAFVYVFWIFSYFPI